MRRTLSVAVLGLGIAGVASSPAFALGPEILTAHVPFAFGVGSRTFPAGNYEITTLSELDRQVVEIQSRDGRYSTFVMTDEATPGGRGTHAELIFDRYGTHEFLHAIHLPYDDGATLRISRSEFQAARDLAEKAALHPGSKVER